MGAVILGAFGRRGRGRLRGLGDEWRCEIDEPGGSEPRESDALRSGSAARRRRCLKREMRRCAWDVLPGNEARKGKSAGIKADAKNKR